MSETEKGGRKQVVADEDEYVCPGKRSPCCRRGAVAEVSSSLLKEVPVGVCTSADNDFGARVKGKQR